MIVACAALAGAGCVAGQQRAAGGTVGGLRTIAIVAIEPPPILVHPETEADRQALSAAGLSPPANGKAPWTLKLNLLFPGPGLLLGSAIDVASYAHSSTPRTGEVFVLTQAPAPWVPTRKLAAQAGELIAGNSQRKTFVVDGYAQLPMAGQAANGTLETLPVARRWYNSDASMLDRDSELRALADAILEVGVLNYEYYEHRLVLQVAVKLVDSANGKVIARAREFANPKGQSLVGMLQNQGAAMRELVDAAGQALLLKCLRDIELAPR
jgi:hypothetical protein